MHSILVPHQKTCFDDVHQPGQFPSLCLYRQLLQSLQPLQWLATQLLLQSLQRHNRLSAGILQPVHHLRHAWRVVRAAGVLLALPQQAVRGKCATLIHQCAGAAGAVTAAPSLLCACSCSLVCADMPRWNVCSVCHHMPGMPHSGGERASHAV